MVAMLTAGHALRDSKFGDGSRSGFCLMGGLRMCWSWVSVFSGSVFQIGPGVGETMAELIATGATDIALAPYAVTRF